MPVHIDVLDVVRLKIYAQQGNQVSVNTIHFKCTSESGGGCSDRDAAEDFDAYMDTNFIPMLNQESSYRGVTVQIIRPANYDAQQSVGFQAGGGGGITPLPNQICGMISWQTGLAGRANRGRMYVPFPSTNFNSTSNHPNTTYITLMTQFLTGLLPSIEVINGVGHTFLTPVIFHVASQTSTVVTQAQARQGWATQRKRGDYGRTNIPPF